MSTVTQTRKPVKTPSIRLMLLPSETNPFAVVRIAVNRKATDYRVSALSSDFGQGFAVEKIDPATEPETYHVNLNPQGNTYDCKGHARWGHCKHADGIAALLKAGKL